MTLRLLNNRYVFNSSHDFYVHIFSATGTCFVTGRDHFNTFDNTPYRFFQENCSQMLVLDKENPEEFKVVLNGNSGCEMIYPCQKSLDLILDGAKVYLGAKTNTTFIVKVNDKPVDLPYTDSWPYVKKVGSVEKGLWLLMFVVVRMMLMFFRFPRYVCVDSGFDRDCLIYWRLSLEFPISVISVTGFT